MTTARKATGKSTAGKSPKKSTSKKFATAKKTMARKAAGSGSGAKKSVTDKAVVKPATRKAVAEKAPGPKLRSEQATRKAVVSRPAKSTKATKSKAKKLAKSPLSKKFVEEMKARLLEERAKYLQTAEDMRAEADSLFDDREPGDVQFDEESGEGDTLAVERERGLALSSQASSAVQQIDEALARIEADTYGICVTSGLPIPKARLEAIPWAAERVEYKVGGLSRR